MEVRVTAPPPPRPPGVIYTARMKLKSVMLLKSSPLTEMFLHTSRREPVNTLTHGGVRQSQTRGAGLTGDQDQNQDHETEAPPPECGLSNSWLRADRLISRRVCGVKKHTVYKRSPYL